MKENLILFAHRLIALNLYNMKTLNDFKQLNNDCLKTIKGGLLENGKGKFVHTGFVLLNNSCQDVYYDSNNNGSCDDNERASLSLVVADNNR